MWRRIGDWLADRGVVERLGDVRPPRRGRFLVEVVEGVPVSHPVLGRDVLAYELDVGWLQELPRYAELRGMRLLEDREVETMTRLVDPFTSGHRPAVTLRSRDGVSILLPADIYTLRDGTSPEGRPLATDHPLVSRLPSNVSGALPGYRSRALTAGQVVLVHAVVRAPPPSGTQAPVYRARGESSARMPDADLLFAPLSDARPVEVHDQLGHPGFDA